MMEFGETNYTF
ncbi:Protein of unknown function [Bacillus mycoides]|nr:Protein of unknown function [Bacillus mycoides]